MSIPSTAYLGDTLTWRETFATGSTGKGFLRHIESGDVVAVDAVVNGASWNLDIAGSLTDGMPSGNYSASVVIDLGATRETRLIGSIVMRPPVSRPVEESHARRMVKMLEAHLEGRISDDEGRGIESYTIGGVPITKIPIPQAKELLAMYRVDLKREVAAARLDAGLGTGRMVYPTFN